jgi:hypothetical protein
MTRYKVVINSVKVLLELLWKSHHQEKEQEELSKEFKTILRESELDDSNNLLYKKLNNTPIRSAII